MPPCSAWAESLPLLRPGSENMSYIEKAKVAEQAERYEDMVKFMRQHVLDNKAPLAPEERNLLSVAYKNVIGSKRSAHRVLDSLLEREKEKKESENLESIKKYCEKVTTELQAVCNEVFDLLDEHLLKNLMDDEATVFYCKMKGDYYRYLAETQLCRDEAVEKAKDAYDEANKAGKNLPTTHPVRLGLALNFSVYYYEIVSNQKEACVIAKEAFDAAISDLDSKNHPETYKDSTLILQLLRDNLTLWSSEAEVDEEEGD